MALAVLSKFNKNNLTFTRWVQTMILLAVIELKECGTTDYQKCLSAIIEQLVMDLNIKIN